MYESAPAFLFRGFEMINRSEMSYLMQDLLSAGILLSLCAVIVLGAQARSSERATSRSTDRARVSAAEESVLSISEKHTRQVSTKHPNQ